MTAAWRNVFTYNKYAQITARALRSSLKDDLRVAAEKRGQTSVRYQQWQDGKGGAQSYCTELAHTFRPLAPDPRSMRTPNGGHPESRLALSTARKDLQEQRPSAPALVLHAHGTPRTPREPRLILTPARVHTLRDPDPKSESVHQGETLSPLAWGLGSHNAYDLAARGEVDLDVNVKEYPAETASATVLTGGANRLGNPGTKLYVWALVALIARLPREVEVVRRHSGRRRDPSRREYFVTGEGFGNAVRRFEAENEDVEGGDFPDSPNDVKLKSSSLVEIREVDVEPDLFPICRSPKVEVRILALVYPHNVFAVRSFGIDYLTGRLLLRSDFLGNPSSRRGVSRVITVRVYPQILVEFASPRILSRSECFRRYRECYELAATLLDNHFGYGAPPRNIHSIKESEATDGHGKFTPATGEVPSQIKDNLYIARQQLFAFYSALFIHASERYDLFLRPGHIGR
ncbi:hypothetical protein NMY22_g1432 [Coprinellus aureogranulatus]|nr:hypothetical protein NMY22_g1432 [Coprinellus aureogranulatus]